MRSFYNSILYIIYPYWLFWTRFNNSLINVIPSVKHNIDTKKQN